MTAKYVEAETLFTYLYKPNDSYRTAKYLIYFLIFKKDQFVFYEIEF